MYARVVTAQFQLGKLDEEIQIYRDSVLPASRQQQGFKGVLHLVDRNTGKGISIILWETEADMQTTGESSYLQAQQAKVASLLAAAPVIETYEVALQE